MRNAAWWMVLGSLVLGVPLAHAQDDSALQRAYRKEFAFLEAEKRALESRLAQVRASGEQKVGAAERELQQLATEVTALTMQADTLMERLTDAERQTDVAAEGSDLIEAALSQASVALEKGGVAFETSAETPEARAKQLGLAFDNAVRLLGEYGQVRAQEGSFFGAKGSKIEGRIVKVGNVAAYGLGKESGALAPAGGGRYKLYESELGTATAKALVSGHGAPTLGLFLFESLEKGFEAKADKTWLQIVQSGGVIAWVIVGLGVLALLMLLVRVVILARNSVNTARWVDELTPLVRAGKHEQAAAKCAKSATSPGRVLTVTLQNLTRPREQLEDLVSEQIMAEAPRLDRFAQMVLVFAAVAPLLGLLGTVTGMISTFDVITEFGTGNPKLLSGGISEALVTTELGLIVAIPSLLGGNMLAAWGERIKADMDRASLRLSNVAFGKAEPRSSGDDAARGDDEALGAAQPAPAE